MDSLQEHAENEDKHLISHVASIINNNQVPAIKNISSKITSSEDRHCLISNYGSVSLEGEHSKHLAGIVVNNANISSHTITNSILNIDFYDYFNTIAIRLHTWIAKIYKICNSDSKCTCDCKCESDPKCKGRFICLCLCIDTQPSPTGYCICICKKNDSKCVCISICKNSQACNTQHTCRACLVKVDIGELEDESFNIFDKLHWVNLSISKLKRKGYTCSCCQNGRCVGSCSRECQSTINCYHSIISKTDNIVILFDQITRKIRHLRTLKNILSYSIIADFKECKTCKYKDKIKKLIEYSEKALSYYYFLGSRINDLGPFVQYNLKNKKWKHISCSLKSSSVSLPKHLDKMNNNMVIKLLLITMSQAQVIEYKLMLYDLSKHLYMPYDMIKILESGTKNCCCICCFKFLVKCKKIQFTEYHNTVTYHFQTYVRWMVENDGNALCLCLLTNYVFIPNVKALLYYITDIVGSFYSSSSRRFDKYTQSTTHLISIGKMIILIISAIYKVTSYMKKRYLCTCPLNCPCLKNGKCSSDCPVCRQPPVKCCFCPEMKKCPNGENQNNSVQNNNFCICKCKDNQTGSCCSGCQQKCKTNECCRCCCNCFCKNVNDPFYPYLVSIILWISSLIENIWTADNSTVNFAIQSLSSLMSEYQWIHFYPNYYSGSRCRIYPLIVDKKCNTKEEKEKKCCWCVAIVNLLVACVSLCIQFRLYNACYKKASDLCTKIKDFCNIEECTCTCTGKGSCCLLKLASSSELCNTSTEDICKKLAKCCGDCAAQPGGCCQKICQKIKSGEADFLVLGCNCNDTTKTETQVKAQCVFFNNPWGGRSAAVVIVCKCEESNKCCCLTKVIEKLKEPLKKLCKENQCKCQQLTESLDQICKNKDCCGDQCPCEQLKEKFKAICKNNNECLCKKIKDLKELCTENTCRCKKEGCCRCVCCKLLIAAVRILRRACKLNVLEPYKRIILELLSGSKNKERIMRKIINKSNSGTLNITYLLKNNHSYSNTYTDHKNIANSFPSLTVGYGYDTVYEHQEASNRGYTGTNSIRKGYPNIRNLRIKIRNKL